MRSTFFFAAASLGSGLASAQCQVYGIDIQNGGTYFENSELTVPFSLVQEFSGCDNDTANNIIVDPNGDQYECSDTPLLPDYTPETVSCSDWPQDKLYSGDWSLVVISNNGDADPIAYQRDFSLTVGTPTTVTITPTVTATDLETSVSSIVTTTHSTITTTLVPKTTTKKALIAFGKPTLYSHPLSVQVVTKDLFTVTKTRYAPQVTQTTVAVTPSCAAPTPNWIPDPLAKIEITILKTIFQKVNSAKFKRGVVEDAEVKKQFVQERAAKLQAVGLQKRAPDASVVTVTATNTEQFVTETQTQWTTITTTIPTTVLATVTSTPPVVTVTRALLDFAALQTLIGNIVEPTITHWQVAKTTTTKSVPWTVTITQTTTPSAWAAECTSGGGKVW
ncbi:hypothetical protein E4T52_04609 [Aureobasidium sp. EXF-3400]|nr:hypothetical protein E4T51_03625 [Aureobasidium sp. EXF-12344]KAI4780498.1 hypothetical protein E4T52_04609 [Aureobasidium sp. EXF-3400]